MPGTRVNVAVSARLPLVATLLLCLVFLSCDGQKDDGPVPVAVTTEMTAVWDFYPHRLSVLELTLAPSTDGRGGELSAQCNGGDFGILDNPRVRYGFSVWRSRLVTSVAGSAELEIRPGSQVDGVGFSSQQEARIPAGPLDRARALAAYIRGYRILTDAYTEPPPFETDPDLPYDPAEGYTTSGIGIALGVPQKVGQEISVWVRARNTLAPSDRADMNAAIPQATTWVRVDFVVMGADGLDASTAEGETSYYLSFPEYGRQTVHEHADPQTQHVALQGAQGPSRALFGLSGFDIWLNVDGRYDPACTVTQDATNAWGEPVSGPGRYVRELSMRIWDDHYEPFTGRGGVNVDLFLSNSSMVKEVGNLCLGFHGRVTMLQFDDPEATVERPEPAELDLVSGEPAIRPVPF